MDRRAGSGFHGVDQRLRPQVGPVPLDVVEALLPGTGIPAARRTLPLPSVPTPRTDTAVYGLAAVDRRGRIAGHAIVHSLGRHPGTRLDIRPPSSAAGSTT
jgi:hypothetical protein